MTNNEACMEATNSLWQKQEYITPHSRANIVHPERHQQVAVQPMTKLAPIKKEEPDDTKSAASAQELPALIQKLEQNLERELRHISEQDFVTVMKLLKPVQANALSHCSACVHTCCFQHSVPYATAPCRCVQFTWASHCCLVLRNLHDVHCCDLTLPPTW